MTTEYGIFNAEGCVERDLWSPLAATRALAASTYRDEPGVYADGICREHDEQPVSWCHDCWFDEEGE